VCRVVGEEGVATLLHDDTVNGGHIFPKAMVIFKTGYNVYCTNLLFGQCECILLFYRLNIGVDITQQGTKRCKDPENVR
jgi:hypothetical protein